MKRGDIVLARLPYSDQSGFKVRPGLVVQSDVNNQRLDDVILAVITSTVARARVEPTQFLIEIGTVLGIHSGLLHTSAIKCENLITVDQQLIQRVIGNLPPDAMQEINACLKAALGIP